MWKQFIDGWHISAQAGAQRAAAMALTAGFGSNSDGGVHAPGSGGRHNSDSDDQAPKSRAAPKDKSAPRQTQKVKAQKDKAPFYFPASKEVIGAALGIAPPSARCKYCQNTGHFHSDCPIGWARRGHTLPGFNRNGKKVPSAWDGDNPTKDTFAAWMRFWKDTTAYENGPAVRDGAPDLAALRKARREGAPP